MSGRGAFGCSNRTESGKAFFLHFDRKRNDQQRRLALLHRIGCKKFVSSKNIRLYEDLFLPDDFEKPRVDGKKLKWIAVPGIFQHRPQKKKKTRKPLFSRPVSQQRCQQPMPGNPGKALEAPQFTDNQGAHENPEEIPHCEGAPASSEGNGEFFVDGSTAMECSVAGTLCNYAVGG
ncbi:hypothetical protein MRX96_003204 [Rhipicephalus microplus]